MSIRNKALQWYEAKYRKVDKPIYTSKFYLPEESWPKESVWWPQIPLNAIDLFEHVHILCEVEPNGNNFHHLKVPTKFLKENLEKFDKLQGKISLYCSTEPTRLFNEVRGTGNIKFHQFLVIDTIPDEKISTASKKDSRFDPYKNFNFRVVLIAAAVASVVVVSILTKKHRKG